MKRIVKVGFMMLLGAAIWTNGGVEKADAQTGGYWEQAQQQQQQQQRQQEQINQQNQMMYSPQYACVNGRDIYGYIGDTACGGQPTNPGPVVYKPSSYGAVAWDGKRGLYGSSTRQVSKQAGIDAALQKCGSSTCQLQTWYANQCVAVAYGLQQNGKYLWVSELGFEPATAENKAINECGKDAKNCQILLSECSPAGEIDTASSAPTSSQTQQYKGLGE